MDEIYLSSDVPTELKAEVIKRCMRGKCVIYVVPHLFEISLINAKLMNKGYAFVNDTNSRAYCRANL